MIARVASTAPLTPPETGASTYSTPCPASSVCTRTAAAVPMVEWSTTSRVLRSEVSAISRAMDSDAPPSGTQRWITSTLPAKAAFDAASSAPCGARGLRPRRVVHHDAPPRLHEIRRHRSAHVAEADEADIVRCHAFAP